MRTRLSLGFVVAAVALSPAAMAQGTPNPAVQAACHGDVQRFCTGVQPGGGRIGQCLKAHARELSPGCVDAVRASRRAQQPPPQ